MTHLCDSTIYSKFKKTLLNGSILLRERKWKGLSRPTDTIMADFLTYRIHVEEHEPKRNETRRAENPNWEFDLATSTLLSKKRKKEKKKRKRTREKKKKKNR